MDIRKIIIGTAFMACPALISAQNDINDGGWTITFDKSAKTLTYTQKWRVRSRAQSVGKAAPVKGLSKR